jgi:hypothetical protein
MQKRIPHIISQGKANESQQNVVYCDSESRIEEGTLIHRPYLMCATFVRYKKKKSEISKDYPNCVYDFWNDLCNFAQYKTTTYCYAHNMGYDMIATSAITILEDNGFRLESFFEKGGTTIYKFLYHEYDEAGEKVKDRTKTISLLSSTNFYSDTLANIARVFGLEKTDIKKEYGEDYNNITMENAIEYCRQDVLILKTAMEALFSFIKNEDLGCMGKTAASQSFNAFKHRFMEHNIYVHTNEKAINLERKSYYGGRVECWQIGERANDDYYYIDVNSMYPFVMANFDYPTKLLSYQSYNSIHDIKTAIDDGEGVVVKVKIKTDKPYFPLRRDKKLIFPVGEFWTYLATPEIKFAIENNLIVEVAECSYYKMDSIFKPFVDYFYNKRLDAKKNKDEVHSYLFKLIMNCLYGKFGQLKENWESVGHAPKHHISNYCETDIDTGEEKYVKELGGTRFEKVGEDSEAFNSFPAVASHVTSQARIHLLNHILKAEIKNVYYMDTDSLFINKEGYHNLKNTLDENILGKMKVEDHATYIKINAPKDYVFIGDKKELIKRKGISKDARPLTDQEYIEYINKRRKQLSKNKFDEFIKNIKREELTMNMQWCKMPTFINEGNISQFYNINRVKSLSRKYNKGTVCADGSVLPFVIHDK